MTDEGSVARAPGRPAAGWKGRMSSMLLRNPVGSPKADTIKAKKVLAASTMSFCWLNNVADLLEQHLTLNFSTACRVPSRCQALPGCA